MQRKYELIDIPSQGRFYPEGSPFAEGSVPLAYMTAQEEDILLTESFMKKGVMFDKLLESLIQGPGSVQDLVVSDKTALLVAARAMGYGHMYKTTVTCEQCGHAQTYTADLTKIQHESFSEEFPIVDGEFKVTLPVSGQTVWFAPLTVRQESKVEREIARVAQMNPNAASPMITLRLTEGIKGFTDDDGNRVNDQIEITKLVYNLTARDSRALRAAMRKAVPAADLTVETMCESCGHIQKSMFDIDRRFFWPSIDDEEVTL